VKLIGVDLAWKPDKHPTAVATWQPSSSGGHAELAMAIEGEIALREWIDQRCTANCMLAVDAPLIIRNTSGQRRAEAELNAEFRKHGAGAHPNNLSLYPHAASVRLAEHWRASGFDWYPKPSAEAAPDGLAEGRWLAEVYPHPAQIGLFGREKIIRYKRGSAEVRRAQLAIYQAELAAALRTALPAFLASAEIQALFSADARSCKGRALKAHEDALDACFCVLIAARLAAPGAKPPRYFGNEQDGFIVVPIS